MNEEIMIVAEESTEPPMEEILPEKISDTDEATEPLEESEDMSESEEATKEVVSEVAVTPDGGESIESLRAELEELRRELTEKKCELERMSHEIGEFSTLFPDTPISTLPDSVWESVRAGTPLAAAYALYEKKAAMRRADAERVNEKNGRISTGSVVSGTREAFFSPDEVRAMSREEIKANYSKILDSMKRWS